MRAHDVYAGSRADITRRYYALLQTAGPRGQIAAQLMRAQKASARAKRYHGRVGGDGPRYRDLAYNQKAAALAGLELWLARDGTMRYGWGRDETQPATPWVLYVELPQGQVSFHSIGRGAGPDYAGAWDGQHASQPRILAFCDSVLAGLDAQQPILL